MSQNNNPYSNLTRDDLELAEHYAETGNKAGLRKLYEKGKRLGQKQRTIVVHGNSVQRSS